MELPVWALEGVDQWGRGMWEGAGRGSRQWEATACGVDLEAAQRGGRGSVGRRRWRWRRMWATHGLAVALALSVLPGSRALRPGDCEGAAGPKSARRGWPGATLSTTKPSRGRGWNGRGRWRPVPAGSARRGADPGTRKHFVRLDRFEILS